MVKFTCSRCKFVLCGQVPLLQISTKTSIYTGETILVVRWCPNGCELTAAPGHDEGAPACPENGQAGAPYANLTRSRAAVPLNRAAKALREAMR